MCPLSTTEELYLHVYVQCVLFNFLGLRKSFLDLLTLSIPVTKLAEFANSVDLDEVAHHEPPHLDLQCLS